MTFSRECKRCVKIFTPDTKHQKYCLECKKKIRNHADTKRTIIYATYRKINTQLKLNNKSILTLLKP